MWAELVDKATGGLYYITELAARLFCRAHQRRQTADFQARAQGVYGEKLQYGQVGNLIGRGLPFV